MHEALTQQTIASEMERASLEWPQAFFLSVEKVEQPAGQPQLKCLSRYLLLSHKHACHGQGRNRNQLQTFVLLAITS